MLWWTFQSLKGWHKCSWDWTAMGLWSFGHAKLSDWSKYLSLLGLHSTTVIVNCLMSVCLARSLQHGWNLSDLVTVRYSWNNLVTHIFMLFSLECSLEHVQMNCDIIVLDLLWGLYLVQWKSYSPQFTSFTILSLAEGDWHLWGYFWSTYCIFSLHCRK